jgi:hypothetical protein
MVSSTVFWLNAFPTKNGVSNTLSPRTIVTGATIDFNRHCQLKFGEYAQVDEEHDNSMASRTTGAIALRPTGNAQGGYYFYSVTTGRRLNRYSWTKLPMPQDVIDHIHVLARRYPRGLEFGDRNGNATINDYEDADDDTNDDMDADSSYHNSSDSDDDDDDDNDDQPPLARNDTPPEDDASLIAGVNDNDDDDNNNDEPADTNDTDTPTNTTEQENITAEMDSRYGLRTREGLRPRRRPDYSHLHHMNGVHDHPAEHTAHTSK